MTKRRAIADDRVTILGDGQMALVLADAAAFRGLSVRIWSPVPEQAPALQAQRISPRLPGFRLPDAVEVTGDAIRALDGATLVVSAIPTQYLRAVWQRLRPVVGKAVTAPESRFAVISVTKGIEVGTGLRPTQVIAEAMAFHADDPRLCVLSGPSIAAELARRLPATLVAAAVDQALAQRVQEAFTTPWLRIYRLDDVVGVEVAGAAKNIIALAAGMIDGIQAGDNAKSAVLARGLAEIARLGVAMGARLETFFGIAGVGDLATTCFSPEGRNRTCGERLGRGEALDDILASMTSVVEGVPTAQSIVALASRLKVDMPITEAVHDILFKGLSPAQAIRGLMSREPKAEQIG